MCAVAPELTQLRHAVATYSAAGANISGAAGIWLPAGQARVALALYTIPPRTGVCCPQARRNACCLPSLPCVCVTHTRICITVKGTPFTGYVVPDILANGGGVVTSYFEWVQNRMGYSWIAPVVEKRLRRFMVEGWNSVQRVQEREDVHMRKAASIVAVERVAAADQLRGIYA